MYGYVPPEPEASSCPYHYANSIEITQIFLSISSVSVLLILLCHHLKLRVSNRRCYHLMSLTFILLKWSINSFGIYNFPRRNRFSERSKILTFWLLRLVKTLTQLQLFEIISTAIEFLFRLAARDQSVFACPKPRSKCEKIFCQYWFHMKMTKNHAIFIVKHTFFHTKIRLSMWKIIPTLW